MQQKDELTEVVDGHDRRGSKNSCQKVRDSKAEDFWGEKVFPGEAEDKDKRIGENGENSSKEHYGQKNKQHSFLHLIFHAEYVFVTFGTIHTKFCSNFHFCQIAANWDQVSVKSI